MIISRIVFFSLDATKTPLISSIERWCRRNFWLKAGADTILILLKRTPFWRDYMPRTCFSPSCITSKAVEKLARVLLHHSNARPRPAMISPSVITTSKSSHSCLPKCQNMARFFKIPIPIIIFQLVQIYGTLTYSFTNQICTLWMVVCL